MLFEHMSSSRGYRYQHPFKTISGSNTLTEKLKYEKIRKTQKSFIWIISLGAVKLNWHRNKKRASLLKIILTLHK